MRSAVGPFLVILGLATTLLAVILLFQVIGLRDDLGGAEERVASLQAQVEAQEPGVTAAELRREVEELRNWTRDWLIATEGDGGGDVGTPAGGGGADDGGDDEGAVLSRIDEVLERLDALDARIDEICEGVPVC